MLIDYYSNLETTQDSDRAREQLKLQKHFGYLPVYGPTMPDITQGKIILAHILRDFPGFHWVVEVRDTIITVINEDLAPNWGFRLRDSQLDNDGKVIRSFAGGLLERYSKKVKAMRDA